MSDNNKFSRRGFVSLTGLGCVSALVNPSFAAAEASKKSDIGATFILWGYDARVLEPAVRDLSQLGFHAFETFGEVLEKYENEKGGLQPIIDKYNIPLISGFCNGDVVNPEKFQQQKDNFHRWCKLVKKYGGKVIEFSTIGADRRKGFDYREHKKFMIESMNEYAKLISDYGLVCALHPHTGTPVETQEEVYFVMENVDTRYMRFGPDVGQLEKGGADPVKIVKDFLPLVEHVHLKDYAGGDNGYLGYTPLGEGKVDLKTILKMLEARRGKMAGMIMFELDYDGKILAPYAEYRAAEISHDYLKKLGYRFVKR